MSTLGNYVLPHSLNIEIIKFDSILSSLCLCHTYTCAIELDSRTMLQNQANRNTGPNSGTVPANRDTWHLCLFELAINRIMGHTLYHCTSVTVFLCMRWALIRNRNVILFFLLLRWGIYTLNILKTTNQYIHMHVQYGRLRGQNLEN